MPTCNSYQEEVKLKFSESLSKILLFITTFKIFQSKNRLVGIKYKQAVYNCKNNLLN